MNAESPRLPLFDPGTREVLKLSLQRTRFRDARRRVLTSRGHRLIPAPRSCLLPLLPRLPALSALMLYRRADLPGLEG